MRRVSPTYATGVGRLARPIFTRNILELFVSFYLTIGFLFNFSNTRRVGIAHHFRVLVGNAHPTLYIRYAAIF